MASTKVNPLDLKPCIRIELGTFFFLLYSWDRSKALVNVANRGLLLKLSERRGDMLMRLRKESTLVAV